MSIFQSNGRKAGQHVPHLHVHVVPRYPASDPDRLFRQQDFPISSQQEQQALAAHLRAALAELPVRALKRTMRPGMPDTVQSQESARARSRSARSRTAWLLLTLVASLLALARPLPESAWPAPPQALYPDLFRAVQEARIYSDQKAFADAVPRGQPAEILAQFHARHPRSRGELKAFVQSHFILPPEPSPPPALPAHEPIATHIEQLWNTLTRRTPVVPPYSSLLPLPQPYVVPGGRFREMYYWDSYFTLLGLQDSGRRDLMQAMVTDFADLIDTYGHVPNGIRTYYLSRSQPPFFFEMVGLLSHDPGKSDARYLLELRREYAYWMQGADGLRPGSARRHVVAMPDGAILNRYWDALDTPRDEAYASDVRLAGGSGRPAAEVFRDLRAAAESGWDFSSRWFADARTRATIITTQIVPVDLNSLLFGLENAIRAGCERTADQACVRDFARRAARRRAAMDRYLWDQAAGAYLDYRWTDQSRVRRLSAATLYPLFEAAASAAQATAVAATVTRDLVEPGGLVTTGVTTGEQWDAPNGWAPLQWIAVAGLRHYGQDRLAESIACRFLITVKELYRASGKLVEKYDVIHGRSGGGGEYPTQDGFGWTNGVTLRLMALYPADASLSGSAQCPLPPQPRTGTGPVRPGEGIRP